MLTNFIAKIFGTQNDRVIKKYRRIVDQINLLEPQMQILSDDKLALQTAKLKQLLASGKTTDDILPEAFATVREVSKRTMNMRPYDVQLIGGLALHYGCVAEMKTGEGKTLTASLPLYLNALTGKGVHLVTVNDYLAKRDAEWMMPIYNFLGMTVRYLQNSQEDAERQEVYAADIVYGTNNEFGFDYLRDNMKFELSDYVQRDLNYAIVDEVDSILIDEARTPLIISGPSDRDVTLYQGADQAIRHLSLKDGDYEIDEKARSAMLTDAGIDKLEKLIGIANLYSPENVMVLHHLQQALKAHTLFRKDIEYMVTLDKQVLIVDEFTGRALPGRRYSDGLHQAIEAKEGVKVERENQTLATITLQNYFRMYKKLAGMTGTANTDAEEFHKIYKLKVVCIPTHRPMIRVDEEDVIYLTQKAKYKAVVADIKAAHTKGQPVLVGTASIESSEHLSFLLKIEKIEHEVLNAKQHEREAEIIKHAGERGKVTISTSMVGRGTDIKLGEGVAELGGLRVIATERYENRRVDDQLRGRSGRQGDPGSSKFYISLEDDLMRIFGGDRTKLLMERYGGMEENESIEHSLVSMLVKNNQEKLENYHFDTRKHLIEYDDVMNQQRSVVYDYRRKILQGEDKLQEFISTLIKESVRFLFEENLVYTTYTPEQRKVILGHITTLTGLEEDDVVPYNYSGNNSDDLQEMIVNRIAAKYKEYRAAFDPEIVDRAEKWTILSIVDYAWKAHLQNIDHLKEGIGLRGYGQKNPLYEYKKEAFEEFLQMIRSMKLDVIARLFKMAVDHNAKRELIEIEQNMQKELKQVTDAQKHQAERKQKEESAKGSKGGGFYGR